PSSCAGTLANAPLKAPTAVRAAPAMMMGSDCDMTYSKREPVSRPANQRAQRHSRSFAHSGPSCQTANSHLRKITGNSCRIAQRPSIAEPFYPMLRLIPVDGAGEACPMTDKDAPVMIKKYANRRLYNTGTSTYVTL